MKKQLKSSTVNNSTSTAERPEIPNPNPSNRFLSEKAFQEAFEASKVVVDGQELAKIIEWPNDLALCFDRARAVYFLESGKAQPITLAKSVQIMADNAEGEFTTYLDLKVEWFDLIQQALENPALPDPGPHPNQVLEDAIKKDGRRMIQMFELPNTALALDENGQVFSYFDPGYDDLEICTHRFSLAGALHAYATLVEVSLGGGEGEAIGDFLNLAADRIAPEKGGAR